MFWEMQNSKYKAFRLHVKEGCPYCLHAKALLEHYGASYTTTDEPCEVWPTWPAIYGITPDGTQELIGGYSEICEIEIGTQDQL